MSSGNPSPIDENSVIASILAGIGAPDTQPNAQSLADWIALEQGGKWPPSATYNPLNTTQSEPGATSFNSAGVKNYTSWGAGISATDVTIENGYPGILSALRSGSGILNPDATVQAELLKWSGGGYSSIAAGAATAGVANNSPVSTISTTTPLLGCAPSLVAIVFLFPFLVVFGVPYALFCAAKRRWHLPRGKRDNRQSTRAPDN
jgi:hypothetical protein